jgi:hypothetical protein
MDIAIVPKALLNRLDVGPESRVHVNVILSHLFLCIGVTLLLRYPDILAAVPHVCLFSTLLSIPCPGCGITRSMLAFLAGDVRRAWALNPSGPFLCITLAFQVPLRIVALYYPSQSTNILNVLQAIKYIVAIILGVTWLVRIA